MPRVPRLPSLDNQVSDAKMPGVRFSTDAPLAAFGGGESANAVSNAAQNLLGTVTKMSQQYTEQANEARTKDYYAKLNRKKNELMYGYNGADGQRVPGAMDKKGADAFSVMEDLGPRFDEIADELESELSNDAQRQMAQKIRQSERMSFDDTLQKHVHNESNKYQDDVDKSAEMSSRNDAVLNYQNPGAVQKNIEMQKMLVAGRAERMGMAGNAEYIDSETRRVVGQTHAEVIQRMLANKDDRGAKAYYEDVKQEMDAKHLGALDKMVKEGSLLGESQRVAGQFMAEHPDDPKKVLEKIRSLNDPELQKAVSAEVNARSAEDDRAKRQGEESLSNSIAAEIDKTKQLPSGDRWSALPLKVKEAMITYRKHIIDGTQPDTNWGEYYNLTQMAAYEGTRNKFLKINLMEYRAEMADSEFKQIVGLQKEMREKDGKADEKLNGFRTTNEIVNSALNAKGVDPTPKPNSEAAKKVNEFRKYVDEGVKQLQLKTGKKVVDNEEIQKIVDAGLIKQKQEGSGFFGIGATQKFRFEQDVNEKYVPPSPKDIPPTDRNEIIREFQKRKNRAPSDGEIMNYFNKMHGIKQWHQVTAV